MNLAAILTPPPRPAPVVAADPARLRAWAAGGLLAVLLAVNLPGFLRTALDCDPVLFDIFARDMARGRVLYRDMLENNTPAMIAVHAAVRAVAGWSPEVMRVLDLMVVGSGLVLLGRWSHRGRPDRQLLAVTLLAALYLSTAEFCHAQRDVWLVLPVVGGMWLRRRRLGESVDGRVRVGGSVLEGVVWGLGVWLKPHAVIVAAAVWLTGLAWARSRRAGWKPLLVDLGGLVAGGLAVGAAGVAAMMAYGIWEPYLAHMTGWAWEYPGADMYGPFGRWLCRVAMFLRCAPWSLLYLVAPAAAAVAVGEVLGRGLTGRPAAGPPDRPLLAAALVAWAVQAFTLQHVFDYVHIGGELLAVAFLLDVAFDLPAPRRALAVGLLAAVTAVGQVPVAVDRLQTWGRCVTEPATPRLRDRLARFDRIAWADLDAVAGFLREAGAADGEVNVLSDTAMPLYLLTGHSAPTRYYILRNNLQAYQSRRREILDALAAVEGQRFVVLSVSGLRWVAPPNCDGLNPGEWPLGHDWYGRRRWADRVVFRSGRYVVLTATGPEVPALLADLSDV